MLRACRLHIAIRIVTMLPNDTIGGSDLFWYVSWWSDASVPCRYAFTKALVVAFVLTFFSIFDVPVFWPILLLYWIVLFVLTMKRQIRHMIKYRYVPFSLGKQVLHPSCSRKQCIYSMTSLALLYVSFLGTWWFQKFYFMTMIVFVSFCYLPYFCVFW